MQLGLPIEIVKKYQCIRWN